MLNFIQKSIFKYDAQSKSDMIINAYYNLQILNVLMHIGHTIIFYNLDLYMLSAYNIVVTILLILLFAAIKRGKIAFFILFCHIEAMIYTLVCAFFVGWALGVSYILIVYISFSFFNSFKDKYIMDILSICEISLFVSEVYMANNGIIPILAPNVYEWIGDTFGYFTIFLSLSTFWYLFNTYKTKFIYQTSSLLKMVGTDELTGAYTRRYMFDTYKNEMIKYGFGNMDFVVSFCDIDNFKYINDKYGHECGDVIIKEVFKIVKSYIRDKDCLSRWGGDEFVIMLVDTDLQEGKAILNRIREAIENNHFMCEDFCFNITISCGVVKGENLPLEKLVVMADTNMYKAKKMGKNMVIG